MVRAFLAVILLFLLIPVDRSYAQAGGPGGVKIYSGYLRQYSPGSEMSFWKGLFGMSPSQKGKEIQERQCSVEFKSPVSFSHQPVDILPKQLTYMVTFKNEPFPPEDKSIKPKDDFGPFLIKVYSDDDQEYTLDPRAEGKQIGINEEHPIFDSYLIYLVLGSKIDHIEIVSTSGVDLDKYLLDKLEVLKTH